MGTEEDFRQMLNFVSRYEIHPIVDSVYPIERSDEAFKKMENGSQFRKIVLTIQKKITPDNVRSYSFQKRSEKALAACRERKSTA